MRQQYQQIIKSGLQGSAVMGRTYAVIGSIITIVIGIIILVVGIMMHYNKNTMHVQALVKKSQCHEDASNSTYKCKLSIYYQYNNEKYDKEINNYTSLYQIQQDDVISLYIDPNKPQNFSLNKTPSWFVIFLIVIGCALIFFSILYVYFIIRYKGLAVISGLKKVIKQ